MRVILILFLVVFTAGAAQAQVAVPPLATCDPDFKNTMDAWAWMAGRRDMESAQNIIRKPDSTLEYTCFGSQPYTFMNPSLHKFRAIQKDDGEAKTNSRDAILVPLGNYLDQNFGHPYLGGAYQGAAAGLCDAMAQVWFASKCQNFDFGFQSFKELYNTDLRTLPAACPAAERTAFLDVLNTAAFQEPGFLGAIDKMEAMWGQMEACGAPVRTGIIVSENGKDLFPDAVCLAPGCYYDGAGKCQ